MPTYFPRQTIELRSIEEPGAFRKLSFSLLEMAILTGVVLRIFRSFAMTHGSTNWLYLGGMFALGFAFLVGMMTAHLSNYTLHRWTYRAPLFVLVEVLAESAVSLLLIWIGREPNGTVRATFKDWPSMSVNTLITRAVILLLWVAILAGVVSIVRRTVVQQEADAEEPEPPVPVLRPSGRGSAGEQQLMG